ncbi:ATP-binding cassette domain-containing protein [bacterium]|nr:ATP-binding cassette domain-containing protein [bacterium]
MNPSAEPAPLLALDDVSYSVKGEPILERIRLSVRKGELVVIAGRSGSGKTTLLKLAAGLIHPERGRVVAPTSSEENGNGKRSLPRIAFVRQQPENQLVAGTVEEEVAFALGLTDMPRATVEKKVEAALRATGLLDVRKQPPYTLSGGMMQRLAIAAALALKPSLWLFDEPTSYLDPPSRKQVHDLARREARQSAVVYVASDPREWRLGTRLVVVDKGRIIADGKPDEVLTSDEVRETGLVEPETPAVWERWFNGATSTRAKRSGKQDNLPESQMSLSLAVPLANSGFTPMLRAEAVSASRNALLSAKRRVLHDLSLSIGAGECVALIGPAGAGKTTLLEVLAGLTPLDSGTLHHEPQRDDDKHDSAAGLAFQFPERQFFAETVLEEVSYGVRNAGVAKETAGRVALQALWQVGLGLEHAGRSPFDLSGGEARRVALAIVLARRPRLLLLDEPTAGLDVADTERIGELIRQQVEDGCSVVVSGHDLDRFAEWCPRWILLKDGTIHHDGPPDAMNDDIRKTFWS